MTPVRSIKRRLMVKAADNISNDGKPARRCRGLVESFRMIPAGRLKSGDYFEILPDSNFDIAFVFNESGCKLYFSGPYTQTSLVPICGSHEFLFVRFRPGKMPPLADIKPAELVDNLVEVPRIFGRDVNSIGEQLHVLRDIDARQQFIEDLFWLNGVGSTVQGRLCNMATDIVEACGGRIRVADLAREVNVTNRTLERFFLDQIGLQPKRFIRNVRFQNAVIRLRSGYRMGNLAGIAYDCGYSDQSHLIKEFKTLSGRLPSII